MFNKNKFKAALCENELTISDIAKALNISKSAVYRKMNGKSDFFRSEILTIANLIGKDTANAIFFEN